MSSRVAGPANLLTGEACPTTEGGTKGQPLAPKDRAAATCKHSSALVPQLRGVPGKDECHWKRKFLAIRKKSLPGADACPTQAAPSFRGSSERLSPTARDHRRAGPRPPPPPQRQVQPLPFPWARAPFTAAAPTATSVDLNQGRPGKLRKTLASWNPQHHAGLRRRYSDVALDVNPVPRSRASLWAERSKPIRKVGRTRHHPKAAQPTSTVGSPSGGNEGLRQDLPRGLKQGVLTARRTWVESEQKGGPCPRQERPRFRLGQRKGTLGECLSKCLSKTALF
ncbi:uncharacterized protein LOC128312581 [Acinonyx jubatus]|uniref:Uncharacterized protein LOC128312581 n=1 Tax=Acinonyx jubatus TaxID=32536 RepID=A0ABM3NUJ5_ACIJB|nr:uncharacterized protein LOC128312581 [Acinonyx jubatus]